MYVQTAGYNGASTVCKNFISTITTIIINNYSQVCNLPPSVNTKQ